jgi:hypothetical protein
MAWPKFLNLKGQPKSFQAAIKDARVKLLELSARDERALGRLYIGFAEEAKKALLANPDRPLGQWTVNELTAIASKYTNGFKTRLDKSLIEAASLSTEAEKVLAKQFIQKLPLSGLTVEKLLFNVPENAVKASFARIWKDGLTLSDRIWALERNTQNGIERIILDSIARGVPASDADTIAQLERFLRPDRLNVRTTLHGRNVSYDASRLLRTERTVAFREAQRMSAERNPGVDAICWELSNSHEKEDECDELASADDGMGPGVYKIEDEPDIPHPNCLCTTYELVASLDEFADRAISWINGGDDEGLQTWFNDVYLKEVA